MSIKCQSKLNKNLKLYTAPLYVHVLVNVCSFNNITYGPLVCAFSKTLQSCLKPLIAFAALRTSAPRCDQHNKIVFESKAN